MKKCAWIGIVLIVILYSMSCSGPKISMEEENVLSALSNIQQGLESNVSYEEFLELLDRAKIEIIPNASILIINGRVGGIGFVLNIEII